MTRMIQRGSIGFLILSAIMLTSNAGVAPVAPQWPSDVIARWAASQTKPGETEELTDPARLADRIIANSKSATEKLAEKNAGADTRKAQDQALKDIDTLLKSLQQPPMNEGGGGGQPPPMDKDQNESKSDSQPMSGQPSGKSGQKQGQSQPKGGLKKSGKQSSGGSEQPKQQNQGSRSERRQQARQEGEKESGVKKSGEKDRKNQAQNKKDDKSEKSSAEPKNASKKPNSGNPGMSAKPKDGNPLIYEDPITKQIWGHLPEKLRMQMNQYYQERFMPKYNLLLKEYFSSLAEKEKGSRKP